MIVPIKYTEVAKQEFYLNSKELLRTQYGFKKEVLHILETKLDFELNKFLEVVLKCSRVQVKGIIEKTVVDKTLIVFIKKLLQFYAKMEYLVYLFKMKRKNSAFKNF